LEIFLTLAPELEPPLILLPLLIPWKKYLVLSGDTEQDKDRVTG
jgi:hypothetical protein